MIFIDSFGAGIQPATENGKSKQLERLEPIAETKFSLRTFFWFPPPCTPWEWASLPHTGLPTAWKPKTHSRIDLEMGPIQFRARKNVRIDHSPGLAAETCWSDSVIEHSKLREQLYGSGETLLRERWSQFFTWNQKSVGSSWLRPRHSGGWVNSAMT